MNYFLLPKTSGRKSYLVTLPLVSFSICMHLSAGALFLSTHLKTACGVTPHKAAKADLPPTISTAFDIDKFVFSISIFNHRLILLCKHYFNLELLFLNSVRFRIE
jgi:hypothetical protein